LCGDGADGSKGLAMSDEREDWGLAGDHMTYSETADGTLTLTFSDKGNGRTCSDCQLCCKLLPVPVLNKRANQKCQHQRHGKGCAIYADRPYACRTWSCRWLSDRAATEGMPRPDRAHYVIDIVPDHVELIADEKTPDHKRRVDVITVWCDPVFPDAYRDKHLRAFMLKMAQEYRLATIVRWSSTDAITVFPPPFDKDGQWHEIRGNAVERGHDDLLDLASRTTIVRS
jgi:hypothetical protein